MTPEEKITATPPSGNAGPDIPGMNTRTHQIEAFQRPEKESQAAVEASKTAGNAMKSAMAKVTHEATEAEREVSAAFRALGERSDDAIQRSKDRIETKQAAPATILQADRHEMIVDLLRKVVLGPGGGLRIRS